MKFALTNGEKTEAIKGAKGVCPICGSGLIAKCGEVKIHHWSHKGNRNCDPWWENETDWHRSWKDIFPIAWQEVIHYNDSGEKHIADVKTQNGWVIEFQYSYLSPDERRTRIAFYRKLIWVINGTRRKKDKEQFFKVILNGTWIDPKSLVRKVYSDECVLLREWAGSNVPVFFDFGDEQVLWWLLDRSSIGNVYFAKVPRAFFIEIHTGGMTNKANDFDMFVKDISGLIAKYESYIRARR